MRAVARPVIADFFEDATRATTALDEPTTTEERW
jgi:hypothetical protein